MKGLSRRAFFTRGAAAAGMVAMPGLMRTAAAADVPAWQLATSGKAPFVPVRILDTDAMPWPEPFNDRGWQAKTLFDNPETGDHLLIISVPIGAPGGRNHYHDFHEWAYWLTGDFVNNEYMSPWSRVGEFQQFREGVFLDRPAYSLHGGEIGRLDSQVGGTCLIMEEGGKTHYVIPGDPGSDTEFKTVKQWTTPRIVDTIADMPWEPLRSTDGILVKRLAEDQKRGFRATLWQVPAGWQRRRFETFGRPYYYEQAHEFNFVLNGSMRIETYPEPFGKGQLHEVGKSFFIDRPPNSIFGLATGEVSKYGCVWLQVTYAKGTAIPNLPIEPPQYI